MGSFSVFHWLIVGVIVYVIYSIFARGGPSGQMVCKSCGTIGEGKSSVRGSIGIEIILWLCLIIPGLIYSLWRLSTRRNVCAKCGGAELIPVDSPIGRKIIDE